MVIDICIATMRYQSLGLFYLAGRYGGGAYIPDRNLLPHMT